VPTVGLNIENINYKKFSLTFWDVGGQATKLWKHYFDHIDGIVFVIDSSDEEKLLFVNEEITKLIKDESLLHVPFMLFFNKQDLGAKCKSKEELSTRLDLKTISEQREVSMQECSALSASGVWEGLDKLILMFENKKGANPVSDDVSTNKDSKRVND
jgi:signal recognition particle receptor subunit beta